MRNSFRCRLAAVLFSLSLLFILLVTSFEAVCYWMPGLYEKEFERYHVLDSLSYWRGEEMDMDGLNTVMRETMSFLRGDRENLIVEVPIDGRMQEFYNADEISHMTDVRNLFVLFIRLRYAAAALCVLLLFLIIRDTHRDWVYTVARGFARTCGVILLGVLALGALIATDFSKYFVVFHEIFFSQGNWMFDVRKSRMIDIMPEEFFSDIALYIAVTFLISVAVLLAVSVLLARKMRPSKGEKKR